MIKTKIYKIVENGSHGNKLHRIFDYFIISLILWSVIVIIVESIPEINIKHSKLLRLFNLFSIIIFSIEYVLRLYVSDISHPKSSKFKSALSFIFSTQGLIDLLTILPFYLPMLIKMDLRFIRLLRLTKFFRILKVNSASKKTRSFSSGVIKNVKNKACEVRKNGV